MKLFDNYEYAYLTLEEINNISNLEEREYVLSFYKDKLLELSCDRLARKVIRENVGKSLSTITSKLEEAIVDNSSFYTFSNDIVLFYPMLREARVSKNIICDVTGAEIKKGSYYYTYGAMLENITNGHIYVLDRPLRSELGFSSFFPETISEFDCLKEKLECSNCNIGDEYDYYGISTRIGGGLSLRKLR